jgi:hypothetical protein
MAVADQVEAAIGRIVNVLSAYSCGLNDPEAKAAAEKDLVH